MKNLLKRYFLFAAWRIQIHYVALVLGFIGLFSTGISFVLAVALIVAALISFITTLVFKRKYITLPYDPIEDIVRAAGANEIMYKIADIPGLGAVRVDRPIWGNGSDYLIAVPLEWPNDTGEIYIEEIVNTTANNKSVSIKLIIVFSLKNDLDGHNIDDIVNTVLGGDKYMFSQGGKPLSLRSLVSDLINNRALLTEEELRVIQSDISDFTAGFLNGDLTHLELINLLKEKMFFPQLDIGTFLVDVNKTLDHSIRVEDTTTHQEVDLIDAFQAVDKGYYKS